MNKKKEIDLFPYIKKILNNKILLIKDLIIFSLFGIIFSLFIPNNFTSSSTFIPQSDSESIPSSSLGSLASLAGFDISSLTENNEIPPTLYPEIVNSTPFKLEILSKKIIFKNEEISFRDYLLGKKFLGLRKSTFNKIFNFSNFFNSDDDSKSKYNLKKISSEDYNLMKIVDNNKSIRINKKEGFIVLTYSDQDKYVSAQILNEIQQLLQSKIIEFKIQSSKETLAFTQKQYEAKKNELEIIQDEIGIFKDKNQNLTNSLLQNKLERLQSEFSILNSVVTGLANQTEAAKIQVNKDTPVFTIINPVNVPFKKSSPKRSLIVVLFAILGLIYSFYKLFIKNSIKEFISRV